MLPATSNVRVWNDEVDRTFGLYEDVIVLGIVNEKGVFNKDTLERINGITDEILKIKGVASRDVNSFTTITNVTAEKGTLRVAPLLTDIPENDKEIEAIKKNILENPCLLTVLFQKMERPPPSTYPLKRVQMARRWQIESGR